MLYLINKSNKTYHFYVYGTGERITLAPGGRYYFKGTPEEIESYKRLTKRKIFIRREKEEPKEQTEVEEKEVKNKEPKISEDTIAKSFIESVNLRGEKVYEEPSTLESDFEKKESLKDDENLSAEAVYTYDFLTKKKALEILEKRGIPFDQFAAAADLKNMVINSNPLRDD